MRLSNLRIGVTVLLFFLMGCSGSRIPSIDGANRILGLKQEMVPETIEGYVEKISTAHGICVFILRNEEGSPGRFQSTALVLDDYVGKRIRVKVLRTLDYVDETARQQYAGTEDMTRVLDPKDRWQVVLCTLVGDPVVLPEETERGAQGL